MTALQLAAGYVAIGLAFAVLNRRAGAWLAMVMGAAWLPFAMLLAISWLAHLWGSPRTRDVAWFSRSPDDYLAAVEALPRRAGAAVATPIARSTAGRRRIAGIGNSFDVIEKGYGG